MEVKTDVAKTQLPAWEVRMELNKYEREAAASEAKNVHGHLKK